MWVVLWVLAAGAVLLAIWLVGERGRQWASDRYHAKVLRHEHAKAIITIEGTFTPHGSRTCVWSGST